MARSAHVTSIEALAEFKAHWCQFAERGLDALLAIDADARRVLDWLEGDVARHWAKVEHDAYEEIAQAKAALMRKRLAKVSDVPPDMIEEKKELERAKAKLERAQEKLDAVKKWSRIVQQALEEYQGQARQLVNALEGNPPPGAVVLDTIVQSLEQYLQTAPSGLGSHGHGTVSPASVRRLVEVIPPSQEDVDQSPRKFQLEADTEDGERATDTAPTAPPEQDDRPKKQGAS